MTDENLWDDEDVEVFNDFEDDASFVSEEQDTDQYEEQDTDQYEEQDTDQLDQEEKQESKEKKLNEEYDSSFDGIEKALHKIANMESELTVSLQEIKIENINMGPNKKTSRSVTLTGLTSLVGEWGVVTPIHVLAVEDEDEYLLLDGLRRIYGAAKVQQKTIPAMVWNFTNKKEGKELWHILALLINRTEKYKPIELWEQMQSLEVVHNATPGLIEYLLQMEPGDALKLKEVMLADQEYQEYRHGLIEGKYTIEGAYKKLCNERKKENRLEKEDKTTVGQEGKKQEVINTEELLSDKDVKEFLDLAPRLTEEELDEVSIADLDRSEDAKKIKHQEVGKRTFVDENIKKATLARDKSTCQCCGLDGQAWVGVLVYHHVVPVSAGGPDTVDNGLTLCVNCHLTLHNYATGDVTFPNEDLAKPEDLKTFKKIMEFGNIAIESCLAKGIKGKALKEAHKDSKKHPMPKENVKMNKEALAMQEDSEE